jgi:hypothetical protein
MKKSYLTCTAFITTAFITALLVIADPADAKDSIVKKPINCKEADAPYKNFSCLDSYLGEDFFTRLVNYYKLEWGHDGPPTDPKAPPSRISYWPTTPQTTPPMPFTEWPYGGSTAFGVTRSSSVDSPLMAALSTTDLGKSMEEAHIQMYGWLNAGGNVSTNGVRPGGNAPAAYSFTPNTVQLDQAVLYLERLPDTVQKEHIDWGFRLSGMYGENYRYTTAYGIASYQLLGHNLYNGYDFPMVYGELYIPQIAEGLMLRAGRFISIPDIEAQLAPNNYMYTHSLSYTFDNYTNTGILASLAATKNLFLQFGVVIGTDTAPWNWGETVANPFPNPVFPGTRILKDPGAKPSLTAAIRYQTDSGNDNIYLIANGINDGTWGYNNLQWLGMTWYHKFNDQWHISFEAYTLSQRKVLNATDPAGIIANGGFPFTPANGINFNAPNFAQCDSPTALTCTARAVGVVAYINYRLSPLDNISLRPEYYDDQEGQRTGIKTRYIDFGIGWQHWLSPQVELRPEVTYYRSLDALAFNGNSNAGIAPSKNYAVLGSMDIIFHF